MELKRILAKDTKSATDLAMRLCGRDVLIISNHTVEGQTELVVAIDVDKQSPETNDQQGGSRSVGAQPVETFRSQLILAQAKSSASYKLAASPVSGADFKQATQEGGDPNNQEIRRLIRDELAVFKAELSLSLKTSGWQSSLKLSPEIDNLFNSFNQAGMSASLRTLLLDTVKDMRTEQEALLAIRQQLEQVSHLPRAALPQSGIHLIAGPSGVGKTMMAIRLASYAVAQDASSKVAMVSYCDTRPGAWEQIQVLSSQIGIECFRVDNSASLGNVLAGLQGYKLVLIDTASSQLRERVVEIESVCPSCVKHVLVTADSSCATLRRTLRASDINWDSLMVSKLDETIQPWPLVEFLHDNSLPNCAASDGAQVAALKLNLTAGSLIEMALAQLSRSPEPRALARTNHLTRPPVFQVAAVAPRFLTESSPRGLRGSFN
jgi:flagellar biosynthesis protein FlhF